MPPTFVLIERDLINLCTFRFSEPVVIGETSKGYSGLSKLNMDITIVGPNQPYDFSYRLIDTKTQSDLELNPGADIREFAIFFYDFDKTIYGSGVEKVHLTVLEHASIKDKSKYPNFLLSAAVTFDLSPFVHVSPEEAASAEGGG